MKPNQLAGTLPGEDRRERNGYAAPALRRRTTEGAQLVQDGSRVVLQQDRFGDLQRRRDPSVCESNHQLSIFDAFNFGKHN